MKFYRILILVLFICKGSSSFAQTVVDLSSNQDHTIGDLILAMGLNSSSELCDLNEEYSILLGGNLILDSGTSYPICFGNGTTIQMNTGAKITIEDNTSLTLDDVHVFGNNVFWNKIYVEEGSKLTVQNQSLIEDGLKAIEAEKRAFVTIKNSVLKNNRISINLNNVGSQGGTYTKISGISISSDVSYNYNNGGNSETRPYTGILIEDQYYINLSPENQEMNNYTRLNNGIVAVNSSITIESSKFIDIYPNFEPATKDFFLNLDGYAIRINKGIGVLRIMNNEFENCKFGLGVSNGRPDCSNNTMRNVSRGIGLYKNDNINIRTLNDIEATDRCIYVGFSQPYEHEVAAFYLESNYTTITSNNIYAKAIEIQNSDQLIIDNNYIEVNKNEAGILLNEAYENILSNNTIDMLLPSTIETYGYYSCRSSDNIIDNNSISSVYGAVNNNKGFNIITSPKNIYKCNNFIGLKMGMQFWDNCKLSELHENTFDINHKDLVLGYLEKINDYDDPAWIGPQFYDPPVGQIEGWGNLFPNSAQSDIVHNSADKERVQYSLFYVNSQENLDVFPEDINAITDWFIDYRTVLNKYPCSGIPGTDLPEKCLDLIDKILTFDTLSYLDDCKKYMWQYQYYLELLELKDENQLTTECLQFLTNQQNNELVQIAKIEREIKDIVKLSSDVQGVIEEIESYSFILDSLFEAGNEYDSEWEQTLNLYISKINQEKIIFDNERTIDVNKIDSLKTAISLKVVTDPCLQALLDVFEIYLSLLKYNSVTSIELGELQIIANSCPTQLGVGVFLARSIISLYDNTRYQDYVNCLSQAVLPREIENKIALEKMIVFPNPAKVNVNVKIDLKENECGVVRLMDLDYSTIRKINVNLGNRNLTLSIDSLPSGTYLIEYKSNLGEIYVNKLIVE